MARTTCSKAHLRAAVEKLGGQLETEGEGRFITYALEAPRGHHWADGSGAHCLVVASGFQNVTNAERVDALQRVGFGVEPCGPDCEYWDDVAEVAP